LRPDGRTAVTVRPARGDSEVAAAQRLRNAGIDHVAMRKAL